MAKRLKSVFTEDMDTCIYTGSPYVERHHIYGGFNRNKSEKYGFVVPLRYDLHPNGARADARFAKDIDEQLKRKAQKYYEEYIGTRDDFIREFGKSYL